MKFVGIIDDNPGMRTAVEDYLGILGNYRIQFSIGSFSELQEVDKDMQVDVILLDIYLPDINGLEIISLMKKIFPKASVIIVTGNVYDSHNLSKAIERGASSFLFKPFPMAQLNEVIEQLGDAPAYLLQKEANILVLRMHNKYSLRARLGMDISLTEESLINLLLNNRSRKQIADEMNVSISWVNATITRLIHKAGCDNVRSLLSVLSELLGQPVR